MIRQLRVFIVHAAQDKPAVRKLYTRLKDEPWITPWLDEENLFPGQNWDFEIKNALRETDAVIICLSTTSVSKEGYVQKEIKTALDFLDEKPEDTIYLIPLRLDDCKIPERLKKLHWVDYFNNNYESKLLGALKIRSTNLALQIPAETTTASQPTPRNTVADLDLYRFIQIPATAEVSYSFFIGKYPVTNAQYARFLNAPDFGDENLWKGSLKFNEECIQIGRWGSESWNWLQEVTERRNHIKPLNWDNEDFGIANSEHPVIGVSWHEASAYCNWLLRHWDELAESQANTVRPRLIRLPISPEFFVAAGGDNPAERYPWDLQGKSTTDVKEIIKRTNYDDSGIGHTTPVNAYPRGASIPYGLMDMAGNAAEWQANFPNYDVKVLNALLHKSNSDLRAVHGGCYLSSFEAVQCGFWTNHQFGNPPTLRQNPNSFRVVARLATSA